MEEEVRKKYHNFFNSGIKSLNDELLDELWDSVLKMCQKYNLDINKCDFSQGGDSAFILIFDEYVIKIAGYGRVMSDYVSHSNHIVQPIEEVNAEDKSRPKARAIYSVLLEEKLDLEHVGAFDVANAIRNLVRDGYAPLDIKESNFGWDKNGNLRLLDYGELFYKDEDKSFEYHQQLCLKKLDEFVERELDNIRTKNSKKRFGIFR